MTKVRQIVDFLLRKYPLDLASSFDVGKVGLQFGSLSKKVKKVMIALDGTSAVVDEAIENNVDLLITHHPFLFSPILNLDYNSPLGKKMLKVFKHELNLFSMHTNFDCALDGMNDLLATILGFDNVYSVPEVPTADSFMRIGTIDEFVQYVNLNKKENSFVMCFDGEEKLINCYLLENKITLTII